MAPANASADAASSTIARALTFSFVAASAIAVSAALLGWALEGAEAAYSALIAGALVLVVFGPGLVVVKLVSRVSPGATMLIGLLTYVLQLLVALLVLWRLQALDWANGNIQPTWLGGTLIMIAFGCVAVLMVVSLRARIPAFDPTDATADEVASRPRKGGAW